MLLTLIFQQNAQHNTSQVTMQLLKLLKVPVTHAIVIDIIESHPDYPSLFSISDSLSKWKVENMAVETEEAKLPEVPTPFVAFFGGSFIVVTNVSANVVSYLSDSGKQKATSKEAFLAQWNKVVLFAERSQDSGEKNFVAAQRKERLNNARIPFILIVCLAFVGLSALSVQHMATTIIISALAVLKLIGCIVTGLLLWYEIDKANPVLKQICSTGKSTNCDAILSSKGSKLFGWLSWSEIGFFYFAGSFLFLLLSGNNHVSSFALLSWLNVLALPYVLFSIVYQWRIAKQWCPLCLAVQGLLVLEFIACHFGYWSSSTNQPFNASTFLTAITCFSLPVFFWLFAKPILLTAQQAGQYKKELNRLKYNPQLFNALLPKQKQVTVSTKGLGIMLGNPGAVNTIIKVCNPYCGPCAKAHPVLDELLENNADVNVQMIFTATDDEADSRAKPVKHLMALYEKDSAVINKALDDWYGADKKEYDAFADKYKLNGELQMQGEKLEAMDNWCKEMKIKYTPTLFVNGYQLPEVYKAEDLKHLFT